MIPETAQDASAGSTAYDPAGLPRPVAVETSVSSSNEPARDGADRAAPATDRSADLPEHMAEMICEGFLRHDRRDREGAVEAFFEVDRNQFAHLDDAAARGAAEAFVDALWAKDEVEGAHVEAEEPGDGPESFDGAALGGADWSPVATALARRAEIVGMDPAYAVETTVAWRRHKTGGDYWTPTLRAQAREVHAAMGGPERAEKKRHGQSGFGHLPARYLVGLELHDMRTEEHWKQAAAVMTPYFAEILAANGGEEGA